MLMSPRTGTPWFRAIPLGLIERGLVITEVAAVAALALWVLARNGGRCSRRQPERCGGAVDSEVD